jgi:hypothetical protein
VNEIMVPAEGIEPPTFGLQNRCSTAELSRPTVQNQSLGTGGAGTNRGFATGLPPILYSSPHQLAHNRINCHRRCAIVLFEQMSIDVECHRWVGVPQAPADRHHVEASRDKR